MQSAEEFCDCLYYTSDETSKEEFLGDAIPLTCARDKEIVEACKAKAIDWCRDSVTEVGCMSPKEKHWIDLSTYLDSVLSDLEGGSEAKFGNLSYTIKGVES